MPPGLVVHAALGDNKQTQVLGQERVRIGSRGDCDLLLQPPYVLAPNNLLLELARSNGHYVVADFNRHLRFSHNGLPLAAGLPIADGDEVRVEATGLTLQFYPVGDMPMVVPARTGVQVAPFIEHAAIEAAATARRDDAKVFLREFTRELVREVNLSTKVVSLLITVALVGGVLYLGYSAYRELRRSRDLINQQNDQMARMKEAMDRTNNQFERVRQSNSEIIDSLSLAPKLHSEYGGGVCIIAGSYQIVDAATNLPLRYPEFQTTEDGTALQNGDSAQPVLTPDGNGPVFINDYEGTGFHVGGGYVLTNKHLAVEPWKADERVQQLSASVRGRFRLTRLVAFFPGRKQAYGLKCRQSAQGYDLSVCSIEGGEEGGGGVQQPWAGLPVLPLDKEGDNVQVGKRVVMIGYPRGVDRLMATYLSDVETRNLQTRYGNSTEGMLAVLAERGLVKPSTTEGSITDLKDDRIAYNASSAEGASGAPLFGPAGRVVGVNFGSYIYMSNSNYGIPVRYAIAPLQRAGWKQPEPPQPANAPAETDANNTTPAKNLAREGAKVDAQPPAKPRP